MSRCNPGLAEQGRELAAIVNGFQRKEEHGGQMAPLSWMSQALTWRVKDREATDGPVKDWVGQTGIEILDEHETLSQSLQSRMAKEGKANHRAESRSPTTQVWISPRSH